jgi:DNA topoisomerase-1
LASLEEKFRFKRKPSVFFHEITKNAILKAIDNPREIDYNLVNAQQARLDRLVGYELSPVLWRKIKVVFSGSCTISICRLVRARKRHSNFNASASYSVVAEFTNEAGKSFKAKLPKNFNTKKEAEDFFLKILAHIYLSDLETKPTKNQLDLLPLLLYNKKQQGNCIYQ